MEKDEQLFSPTVEQTGPSLDMSVAGGKTNHVLIVDTGTGSQYTYFVG